MKFKIHNSFTDELPGDPILENQRRQVTGACYSYVTPRIPSAPKLIHVSSEVATLLGLTEDDCKSEKFLQVFSGSSVIEDTKPYAMCYGGHQFGNWAGQLGDGRAIILTEVIHEGKQWTLQLKGAGETPYSRTADGLAVLRSSIREHLCSEAMFHLGVPTTRSLSLCLTGDEVMRDIMYDGHPALEKGAVVCRVAPSFIRFGNFQIFASRGDIENIRSLVDYCIRHLYPEIKSVGKEAYLDFFRLVSERTLDMIVHWQRVGFVHGVMNTDNMSILGLTIDYGPYGWLENYDSNWTPNTTDKHGRRYRYGNQPPIAQWNLYQLANALFPLVEDAKPLEEILNTFQSDYVKARHEMMKAKLGLIENETSDASLFKSLEKTLTLTETDMTIFYRLLAKIKKNDSRNDMLDKIQAAFYMPDALEAEVLSGWMAWIDNYKARLQKEARSDEERKSEMDKVNPKYVLRNYMAQLAIDAADNGDYTVIEELHQLLKKPYAEQPENEKWFAKRPEWARHKIGCSMLSCSS